MPKLRLTQSVAVAPELVASRPHSPSEGSLRPLLSPSLIHPSAWKENSANFAVTEFSEVRLKDVLGITRRRLPSRNHSYKISRQDWELVPMTLGHLPPYGALYVEQASERRIPYETQALIGSPHVGCGASGRRVGAGTRRLRSRRRKGGS